MDITIDELNQVYYINKEIKQLYEELANIKQQSFMKNITISDMPRGGESKDIFTEYTDDVMEIESIIQYSLIRLQRAKKKAEKFLTTVDDPELRLIMRLRCINNMSWQDIGDEIGMDRRTASRKFYGYFHNAHTAH